MRGQAEALCTSSKAIGILVVPSLCESLLSGLEPSWPPHPASHLLQRHPAELLDRLVRTDAAGHEVLRRRGGSESLLLLPGFSFACVTKVGEEAFLLQLLAVNDKGRGPVAVPQ